MSESRNVYGCLVLEIFLIILNYLGSGASSDKQPCWRNDSETMRSPLFPTSFNRAWLPPGGKPPTHPASINPATLWMGQFPFAPGALLPYSAGSIDRSPSQHLFHPTGGYKLAQDSITGQFFFIPGSVISLTSI